ncbi:MAG: MBOAT family protein [Candidatus Peribacteraceae bacterium]|nr:MBOAT family protein [Candidatus Peribacteraceae bacterium]
MLFTSPSYLLFFPAVAVAYFALPQRFRWVLLLVASYFFYASWKPIYALLLLCSTIVNFLAALAMGRETDRKLRLEYLWLAIAMNVALLLFFKYFNFINDELRSLFGFAGFPYDIPSLKILLPLGISFYTFQFLGYLIDVYRGSVAPERHFGVFAVFSSFFPQLIAGPIARAGNLLPQFRTVHLLEYRRIVDSLLLILWGFFKKVVIADNLAVAVNTVYDHPERFTGLPLIVTTVFFAFQIYCDFSGYSDIAVGSAQVMGFSLTDNFQRPYAARSIRDFWRRWHISLSLWFRDYIYIPLGGNRVSPSRRSLNLMAVFLLCGLWHGAAWTFVVWGALHGFYQVWGVMTRSMREQLAQVSGLMRFPRLLGAWQVTCTFFLVALAWVFFRAATFTDAAYIFTHFTKGLADQLSSFAGLREILGNLSMSKTLFVGSILSIVLLEGVQWLQQREGVRHGFHHMPKVLRWSVYYILIFAILFAGRFESPFIYFQF